MSRVLVLLMATATVGSAGALWAKPLTKPQSANTTHTQSIACEAQRKRHIVGTDGTASNRCAVGAAQPEREQQRQHP